MKKVLSVILASVMLLSIFSILPAAQRPEEVTAIEYEKTSPVICYFETTGSFDEDDQGEQYFRYDGFGFAEGDVLSVYYQGLEEPVRYTARFNSVENRMEFVSEDNDIISSNEVHTESNQAEKPFTLGSDNYYYVCYKTFKAPVQVTVVENPIKAVEYIPVKPIVIYENTDGYWDTDYEGEEYFYYNNPSFKIGDILRLTLRTGEVVDYTYQYNENDDYWFFYDGDGNVLQNDNELFTTKGYDGNWSLGENNNLYVIYNDVYSEPVKITIVENPVNGIKFTPANSTVYVEGTHMYYDHQDDTHYYDMPWFYEGDILTVIDKNSNEKDYVYDDDERAFISADGERIEENEVRLHSDQNEKPWSVGQDNAYTIEYCSKQATAYVTITENPVKEISFTPAKPVEYIEGTHMWYDEWDDTYYYDMPWFNEGDILTVKDKNNVTVTYTYGYDDELGNGFIAPGGRFIDTNDIRVYSDQTNTPWTVGLNKYTVEYSGATTDVSLKITANCVDSIEYAPVKPVVLVEGQNMWYDEQEDKYYYDIPYFEDGDVLTVHYNDGRGAVAYTLQYNPKTDTRAFFSESGDVIENDWDIIHTVHEQNQKAWSVGSDNCYYVEYSGKRADVQVSIVENNVSAITFTPKNEISIFASDCKKFTDDFGIEHRQYSVPEIKEGDILTVTDKEGNGKDYVYSFNEADGEYYFINGDEKIHSSELEVDPYLLGDDWAVGADNSFTVKYMGAETQVRVNLIDTDVKSIKFIKANPIVLTENKGGEWRFNERGIKFFYYEAEFGYVGDVLKVDYLNGTTVSYTVKFDSEEEGPYLEAPNGDRIEAKEVQIYDDQYNEPWTPGGENVYYVRFHGVETTVKVTLNHDYKAVVTAPKANAVGYTQYKCACGEWKKDAKGNVIKDKFTSPTGKPAGFKCASRTATAEKFTWTKTAGVSGYQVQLLNSAGKSAALATTTGNAYTFSKLAAGHAYKARVRFYIKAADGKNYYGAWTTLASPTLPAGTAITKLTPAKKAFTAQWKKGAVTGYQVQYATNAKFTKAITKTAKGAAKVKLAVKSLKGGAKYYVRVRTYKTIGGKNYYSTWSGAKAVTTKK